MVERKIIWQGRFLMTEPLKPLHRDDLDFEVAEEITEKMQELYPGFSIKFAGDIEGQMSESEKVKMDAFMQQLNESHEQSLVNGTCLDCGKEMPTFDKIDDEDWEPPKGWGWFRHPNGDLMAWQCPECDEKEKEGEACKIEL